MQACSTCIHSSGFHERKVLRGELLTLTATLSEGIFQTLFLLRCLQHLCVWYHSQHCSTWNLWVCIAGRMLGSPLNFGKFKLLDEEHDIERCVAAEPIIRNWRYSHGALCLLVKSLSWWASEAEIYRRAIRSNKCSKVQLHCWSAHQRKRFSCQEKRTLWLSTVIRAWCIIYWAFSCQNRTARVPVHIAFCCSSSYLFYQGTMCQIERCCLTSQRCHLNSPGAVSGHCASKIYTQSSRCCRLPVWSCRAANLNQTGNLTHCFEWHLWSVWYNQLTSADILR